jgi:TIR domain-containing protein/GAF domain-containing protein
MKKEDLIPRGEIIRFLGIAALQPQRRGEMIVRALQELLATLPAVGTALIWPCQDGNVPWKLYYAGTRWQVMRRWLTARLHGSLDATLGVLQQDLSSLSDMPSAHIMCLQPAPRFPAGIWIVWPVLSSLPRKALDCMEGVRQTLEALIEVESLEEHYFASTSPLSDRALIEALGKGDPQALYALLCMTRLVGNADLTCWGRVYRDVVECSNHMGAKQGGFGFAVPRGKGAGGYVATSGTQVLVVEDYRNTLYRHPSVSDSVDSEQIRSVLALPVRSQRGDERNGHITGILYATRRTVKPFSLAEQLLVQRMTRLLEPLPPPTRPSSFLSPGLPSLPDQKVAWHKLVLHANRIDSLENWIGQYIKGSVVVTDSDGRPYLSERDEQLEYLRTAYAGSMDGVQVISLDAPGVSMPSQVYLRSAIPLPPREWPDFFADLVLACNLIIERMMKIDHLSSSLTPAIQYASCFIGYAHQDENLARRLYNDLQDNSVDCWMAPHDLCPGDYHHSRIDEAIRSHKKFLLLLSEHAVNSSWVKHEVEIAQACEIAQDCTILFPLRLDQTVMQTSKDWAVRLRESRHLGDFIDWEDDMAYQQAFTTLLLNLKDNKPPIS